MCAWIDTQTTLTHLRRGKLGEWRIRVLRERQQIRVPAGTEHPWCARRSNQRHDLPWRRLVSRGSLRGDVRCQQHPCGAAMYPCAGAFAPAYAMTIMPKFVRAIWSARGPTGMSCNARKMLRSTAFLEHWLMT